MHKPRFAMTPNNNFSILPFYESLDEQNARKWWVFGRIYPLFTPAGYAPRFQIIIPYTTTEPSYVSGSSSVVNANTGTSYQIPSATSSALTNSKKTFSGQKFSVFTYNAANPIVSGTMREGRYYIKLRFSVDGTTKDFYSDVFTAIEDASQYLKLTWWDDTDFVMDSGAIVYVIPGNQGTFKNVLYLPSDIAKPEYIFEEEGETRDGYFFPIKQISEKRYKFNFFSPEYLLDVLRFVRLSDHIEVYYQGKTYEVDSFLLTPEWEAQGDIAAVEAQFDSFTIAKKLGAGYTRTIIT